MIEAIITGIIQGIAEWLPVSSEGVLVLVKVNFFGASSLSIILKEVLFLHLGTFLAALVYFRKDVVDLIKTIFNYKTANIETQKTFKFLIIATIISGLLGLVFLKLLTGLEAQLNVTGKFITLAVGGLLLITGYLQIRAKRQKGSRKISDIKNTDSVLLGVTQGFSALPGLSRSGLTVSALLLKKFDDISALKLSFLMSLPIVLVGNIILNWNKFILTGQSLVGLIFSFIFGIITIDLLLRLAKKVNFGWFVFIFGLLTILAIMI
ncbi:MAG: undecaprenyl-diphosphate phosphatase [bacterium]